MAEGDTILRTARRIESALGGQRVDAQVGNSRGLGAGVERLDGRRLDRAESRGKHLLLHFDDLVLHSHLSMSGAWHVYRRGEEWRRPRSAAWIVLAGEEVEAVQFGGPTLEVLTASELRRDPALARLGPDILSPDFDRAAAAANLLASPERQLGDALLDQRLVAGIGNIFKSEACFAACTSPWQRIGDLSDSEIRGTLEAARRLMQASVTRGRPDRAVYRRAAGRALAAAPRSPLGARATLTVAPTGAPAARRGKRRRSRFLTLVCPPALHFENSPHMRIFHIDKSPST